MIRAASLGLALGLVLAAASVAGIRVEDRRGAHEFADVPERVVVLDWSLAEQVLDLDVTPVGAPELDLYREWVGEPELPADVTDVGLRTEPNLERIAALRPGVILGVDLDPGQVARLGRIAPVLVFDAFRADHDNVAAARRIYLTLATLFDREDLAQDRLAEMEAGLDHIAAGLAGRQGLPDKATAIRLNDDAAVWIYGANSFPQYVLKRLGFAPELELPAARWGVTQRPLDALAAVREGALLAIKPHMAGATAFDSPLWQHLPAVRAQRFAEVERVWSYGGILSLLRQARAFRNALLSLEPAR